MSPNKKNTWKKTSISFVNDKRQYTNNWLNNSLETVITILQEAA